MNTLIVVSNCVSVLAWIIAIYFLCRGSFIKKKRLNAHIVDHIKMARDLKLEKDRIDVMRKARDTASIKNK